MVVEPAYQHRPDLGGHLAHQKRLEAFRDAIEVFEGAQAPQAVDDRRRPLAVVDERRVDIHALGALDKEELREEDIFGVRHARLEPDVLSEHPPGQHMLHPVEVAVQSVGIGRRGHALHRAGQRAHAVGERRLFRNLLDRRVGEIRLIAFARAEHDLRGLRMKEIVGIEEPDVFAGRMLQPEIPRARNAAVLFRRHDFDAGVFRCVRGKNLRRGVRRAVV